MIFAQDVLKSFLKNKINNISFLKNKKKKTTALNIEHHILRIKINIFIHNFLPFFSNLNIELFINK